MTNWGTSGERPLETTGHRRREFLTRAAAAGVALGAGGLLAGCGSSSSAVTTTSAADGTPKRGGTATVALSIFESTGTLDPARATVDIDLMSTGMLYDNLVALNAGFEPQPALAESWEVSPDARTWTFSLRHGVEFHDGSPLEAKDVSWTLLRVLDKKTASPSQGALAGALAPSGIKIVDPMTIRLELEAPYAFFPQILGNYNLRITKYGVSNPNQHPIGTGPFVYESYVPGTSLNVRRNPNYWRSGLPYLDAINVMSIPEQAVKVQAVLTGNADVADAVTASEATQLRTNSQVQLYTLKAAYFDVIAVQGTVAPYDSVKVRQAIKMSFDRTTMLNLVVPQAGVVGEDIPISPYDALYPSGFETLRYDPEKAKAFLKQAGFESGLPVNLYTAAVSATTVNMATAFASLAAAAGLKVTLVQQTPSVFESDTYLKKPAFTSTWIREAPDTIISQACLPNAVWNESQFTDPTFTKLILAARATTSLQHQRQLYAEAMPILAQTSGWTIPYWTDRIWPAKPRLQGLQLDLIDNANFTQAYLAA